MLLHLTQQLKEQFSFLMSTSKDGNCSKGTSAEKAMVDASLPHVLVVDDSIVDCHIVSMFLKHSNIHGIAIFTFIFKKTIFVSTCFL
jgi:hypothetical protein